MKVTLKKAFSLLDGRLSTEMGDIYEMLNFIFDDNLYTHQIPAAIRILKSENPEWFQNGVDFLEALKSKYETNDFSILMKAIEENYSETHIELGKIDRKIDFSAGLVPEGSY